MSKVLKLIKALLSLSPKNKARFLAWLAFTVTQKVRYKGYVYGYKFYPTALKNLLSNLPVAVTPEYKLAGKADFYEAKAFPLWLQLASLQLQLENANINWHHNFHDDEDFLSLHRFNWLLTSCELKQGHSPYKNFVLKNIYTWIDQFTPYQPQHSKIWESYTVAERVSNILLFCHLTNIKPDSKIMVALFWHVEHLLKNLEFTPFGFGNHVFNNARAIYIFGVCAKSTRHLLLAQELLKFTLQDLLSADGFLREGSSHYQFLFLRWMFEVYYFSILETDKNFSDYMLEKINLVSAATSFFNTQAPLMPLFGDISPDFKPEWLDVLTPSPHNSWRNLFVTSNWIPRTESLPKIKVAQGAYFQSQQSGWYRYDFFDFTLLFRCPTKFPDSYLGHFHDDLFSFEVYFKNSPIFIDVGRKNYLSQKQNHALQHNSIVFADKPLFPFASHLLAQWFYANQKVLLDYSEQKCSITIQSEPANAGFLPCKILTRKFVISPKKFIVYDEGMPELQTVWHFANPVTLANPEENFVSWRQDSFAGSLQFEFVKNIQVTDSTSYAYYGDEGVLVNRIVAQAQVNQSKMVLQIKD